jgi:hypothetical protein
MCLLLLYNMWCATLQGCKVFCLQYINVATIDVPQSSSMANYLEQGDVDSAYKVACLGVTEADWRTLALAALQVLLCMHPALHQCSAETAGVCSKLLLHSIHAASWSSCLCSLCNARCQQHIPA